MTNESLPARGRAAITSAPEKKNKEVAATASVKARNKRGSRRHTMLQLVVPETTVSDGRWRLRLKWRYGSTFAYTT